MKAKSLRLTVLCDLETHHVWLSVFILNFTLYSRGGICLGSFHSRRQRLVWICFFFFFLKKEVGVVRYKNTLHPKRHGIPWMYENGNAE